MLLKLILRNRTVFIPFQATVTETFKLLLFFIMQKNSART